MRSITSIILIELDWWSFESGIDDVCSTLASWWKFMHRRSVRPCRGRKNTSEAYECQDENVLARSNGDRQLNLSDDPDLASSIDQSTYDDDTTFWFVTTRESVQLWSLDMSADGITLSFGLLPTLCKSRRWFDSGTQCLKRGLCSDRKSVV